MSSMAEETAVSIIQEMYFSGSLCSCSSLNITTYPTNIKGNSSLAFNKVVERRGQFLQQMAPPDPSQKAGALCFPLSKSDSLKKYCITFGQNFFLTARAFMMLYLLRKLTTILTGFKWCKLSTICCSTSQNPLTAVQTPQLSCFNMSILGSKHCNQKT